MAMRMLDLFCGRFGWSRAFADRGWECVGIDLAYPADVPGNCYFFQRDVQAIPVEYLCGFDFICASPPCQQFSVHGLKCFYPEPKYPKDGVRLFNHTRAICEASGVPYVIENVRAAQQFVGHAVNRCGPFYLWGSGVPTLMPQGIRKGGRLKRGGYKTQTNTTSDSSAAALVATIPPELSACVAEHACWIGRNTFELGDVRRG